MSTHHHPGLRKPEPPTAKQQRELRRLADRTGGTFVLPKTKAEASAAIARMRACGNDLRRPEVDAPRLGTAFRDDEIVGYGSTATWA